MTYASLHLHRSARVPAARGIGLGLSSRILTTLRLWRRRIQERDALAHLTDRELQDMRISRYDIGSEIHKPFWRD
jgi:uncharacterized protein YjiS (DUF1127 family)